MDKTFRAEHNFFTETVKEMESIYWKVSISKRGYFLRFFSLRQLSEPSVKIKYTKTLYLTALRD